VTLVRIVFAAASSKLTASNGRDSLAMPITVASQRLPGHASLLFRPLLGADVPRAAELETASYPADEAATPEKLEYRQRVAPELFFGVYDDSAPPSSALIGFVVSTAAEGDALEEETMSTHHPGGESICIHSVVVAETHRRKGIARAMVRAYVDAIVKDRQRCGAARRLLLLAKARLLGLYIQCGFELLGPSAIVHGADQWFDMRLDLVAKRQPEMLQVDAFTPIALAGNPAAILFTQRGGDEDWMQAVAAENNVSDTAFLEERPGKSVGGKDEAAWDIRWFTPASEVSLCGHATLASAHVLWETGRVAHGVPVSFHTRKAGVLRCRAEGPWIKMDFPAQPPVPLSDGQSSKSSRTEIAAALGIEEMDVLYIGRGPETTPDLLVEVSPSAFASLKPNSSAISGLRPMDRGIVVTCAGVGASLQADLVQELPPAPKRPRVLMGDGGDGCHAAHRFDFLSRFFAPKFGVDEDPVTGSAHCILAPYWAEKLHRPEGSLMQALQASPRGGLLRVRYSKTTSRVEIEGQAVTVLRGRMVL